MDRAYSVGRGVSLGLEGGDFTKNSYRGMQSDRLRGRIVGVDGESDDAKIAFGSVDKG